MATALLPTSASQPRVAACITGELRTFAMPFVHLNLLRTVRDWRADNYFVFNHHPGSGTLERDGRAVVRCVDNATALALFEPKGVESSFETEEGRGVAWVQLQQWHRCYEMADATATPYEIFVRLRPDYAIMQHPVELPSLEALRGAMIFRTAPKADFAFALAYDKVADFLAKGEQILNRDWGSCCIEFSELFHEPGVDCDDHGCICAASCHVLELHGGLMRSSDWIEDWGVSHRDRTPEEVAQSTCPAADVYALGWCADRRTRSGLPEANRTGGDRRCERIRRTLH